MTTETQLRQGAATSAGSRYDYDPRHYRFQRSHTGYIEASEPLSGWGWEVLRLAGIAAGVAVLWALAWALTS